MTELWTKALLARLHSASAGQQAGHAAAHRVAITDLNLLPISRAQDREQNEGPSRAAMIEAERHKYPFVPRPIRHIIIK